MIFFEIRGIRVKPKSFKIGKIQRRLAWPQHMVDTHYLVKVSTLFFVRRNFAMVI